MSLESLIKHWKSDPQTAPNFAVWRSLPAREADTRPVPGDLAPGLKTALSVAGIGALYSHQAEAWERARKGRNLVLASGTASGKSLAYNLPVLSSLLETSKARALYLFPTKALAQDQLTALDRFLKAGDTSALQAAIYRVH